MLGINGCFYREAIEVFGGGIGKPFTGIYQTDLTSRKPLHHCCRMCVPLEQQTPEPEPEPEGLSLKQETSEPGPRGLPLEQETPEPRIL